MNSNDCDEREKNVLESEGVCVLNTRFNIGLSSQTSSKWLVTVCVTSHTSNLRKDRRSTILPVTKGAAMAALYLLFSE